jgi:hypothetical protein
MVTTARQDEIATAACKTAALSKQWPVKVGILLERIAF